MCINSGRLRSAASISRRIVAQHRISIPVRNERPPPISLPRDATGVSIDSQDVTSPPTPIDMADALMREGRPADAEELMVRELRAVTAKNGRGSPAWASAQCDLGNVLLNSDQLDRAIECFRNAASVPPREDPATRKDHLTYRLNLGVALGMAGRLAEAEAELRNGARERLAFYGREHAGYAFGLEPLADVLLQRGKLREARQVIEEAVDNFWRNGHERVAPALALRAEIVQAEGATAALSPAWTSCQTKSSSR